MSADGTPEDRQGSVLGGLLAPLRLPERALKALELAAEQLGPMRSELARVREAVVSLPDLMERVLRQTESVPELLPAVERISRQAEPLAEMLPALAHLEQDLGARVDSLREVVASLEGDESHLNKTVAALGEEMAAMHKTLLSLQADVKSVTDRMPDASRGPLEKAKDVLTGSTE